VVEFAVQVANFRRRHLANHAVAEAVGLATLTALIGYGNRFLRIDMTESMEILFRECEAGGDYDNLCQYVDSSSSVKDDWLITRQNFRPMAYG
jgi:chloride channel 3/4/5